MPRPDKTEERAARCNNMFKLRKTNPHKPKEKRGHSFLSKITTRMKRHVRHVLKDENPTIWVGKDGLTSPLVGEIEKQLQKNKMVKVRILPASLQENNTAQVIANKAAELTDAALVEIRGHVFILFRKRKQVQPA